MTSIQLCADDFGQDPLINEAVLNLFDLQRLSATSVLVEAPFVRSFHQEIQEAHKRGLQVGLHFNLTLPFASASRDHIRSLNAWIVSSQFRFNTTELILVALQKQLSLFEDTFGWLPDYIDGHQHVHQFPGIRETLIAEVIRRYPPDQVPWIRNTVLPTASASLPKKFKCNVLNLLGGQRFLQQLQAAKIATNQGFLGVYDFDQPTEEQYQQLMLAWLSIAKDNTLIMCHPATGVVLDDAIGTQRPIEYRYFKSAAFSDDLARLGVALTLGGFR